VPLQDDWYAYEDMYVLRDDYNDPVSEAVRKDRDGIMRGGGYQVKEAWERALRSAVAGLEIPPLIGMDLPVAPVGQDVVMASA
jgi:CDK-activating kinase assembly factor MAT1